ncbi:MAG: tetratricopeptide repeat protein [Leptospiraceae bacterium]|nr:tetratricopeptide repeat protein [Leptospiraceae bacterium]
MNRLWLLSALLLLGACASLEVAREHLRAGNQAEEAGNLDQALVHYQAAVDEYKNFPDAWNNIGFVYARRQNTDAARKSFEQAIRLDPRHAGAHFNLARLQEDAGEDAAAMASYRQVLVIEPTHPAARVNLARLLIKAGDRAGGKRELEQVTVQSADYAPGHFSLGLLLYQETNIHAALSEFRKGCELGLPPACANADRMRILLTKNESDQQP